ncbi:MAG TPA: glutamine cyclotransferase [Planctomycetaceae bacterium]|nr:glutamine cyclotransferase [Planctomycetaceae bacterium]
MTRTWSATVRSHRGRSNDTVRWTARSGTVQVVIGNTDNARMKQTLPLCHITFCHLVLEVLVFGTLVQTARAQPVAGPTDPDATRLPANLVPNVTAVHPHDPAAFTQGLLFKDGFLYESTGQYGASSLRKVEIATGKVLRKKDIPQRYFSEGIAIVGHYIYMLTWREKTCVVFDTATFKEAAAFPYAGEGWGLCYDGRSLILSDGGATLRLIDPKTFKTTGKIAVYDGPDPKKGKPVANLNELEFIHGEIWANMLGSKYIVRINPTDGRVIGWINCTNFFPKSIPANDPERVLNGIAFDAATNRIFITGKDWPVLYELQLHE